MVRSLRYGLIGAGMMGQEHIRNLALLEGAQIAAIYEPDAAMRAAAAALAPEAELAQSFEALLAAPGLDAWVIASPNHLHVEQLERIAASRPLPALVEKPLYAAAADAERIAALAARYPALIWVAMEYRYMPPIAAFLEQAEAATGGIRMLTIREHRFPFLDKVGAWNRFNRNTGGTLVEKCCHFFDLMRLALRSEPVRVTASAGQAVNHLDEVYDGERPDVWDHGYVMVDFESGARAMLELCMFADGARYQESLCALGGVGKIEALVPGPQRHWPAARGPQPAPKLIVSPRGAEPEREIEIPVDPELLEAGDHNGATFYQHQLFRQAVLDGGAPAVSLADGAAAVRMGLAAQISAEEGRTVTL